MSRPDTIRAIVPVCTKCVGRFPEEIRTTDERGDEDELWCYFCAGPCFRYYSARIADPSLLAILFKVLHLFFFALGLAAGYALWS